MDDDIVKFRGLREGYVVLALAAEELVKSEKAHSVNDCEKGR